MTTAEIIALCALLVTLVSMLGGLVGLWIRVKVDMEGNRQLIEQNRVTAELALAQHEVSSNLRLTQLESDRQMMRTDVKDLTKEVHALVVQLAKQVGQTT